MNISVDSIFNVINFIARVVVVMYIVRKYVLDQLILAMKSQKQQEDHMREQYQVLKQECALISSRMDEQVDYQKQLQSKFDQWKKQVALEKIQLDEFCMKQQESIDQDNQIKIESLRQKRLIEQECMPLLEQVAQELQVEFAVNSDRYAQYQKNIFQSLLK